MPGAQIIELILSWILTTGLSFAVVLFDERRSTEARLERAWLPVTRNVALVWLGVVALPFHFAKTRGHFSSVRGVLGIVLGFALGLVAATAVAIVSSLILSGVDCALEIPTAD
ncbi:MAG TPA: hypothetical protein VM580_07435 [Labilithrix sp.]|nr:hypothetical protein [Labilithrix sp.]